MWDYQISIFKVDIEDNAEYPMQVGKKTFFSSLVMWKFVGKNWDEICSSRWTKGKIFEDKIEKELWDRKDNFIEKNIQLSPDDEVDFLCEKNSVYYMIEAKNYGPNPLNKSGETGGALFHFYLSSSY